MKVLFAVSNENISNSIMKKYQEQHKEIITGKNVYYFNAIIKELQKDKSYDRIVISEDLEPFANNNYDTIDKFLFDKLDNISDEAANFVGSDIPIILICSDRRAKAEPILVKLFGIGVYSALLGNDRSIDKVCELLNKPRTKKEAKSYYKIDIDDVEYKAESEGEVSEAEIQNILTHYKRLGKNEEKYVESFDSIAAQYTDEQLKIIIRVLPLNVRAVLEEKSAKYQQLTTFANIGSSNTGKKKGGYVSSYEKEKRKKQAAGGDLIEKQVGQPTVTKPVIIPSTMNTQKVKKVATPSQSLGQNLKQSREMQKEYIPAKERMKKEVATESLGQMHAKQRTQPPLSGNVRQPRTAVQSEAVAIPKTGNISATATMTSKTNRMYQPIPAEPVKAQTPRMPKQEEPVKTQAPAMPKTAEVAEPPIHKRRGRPRKAVEEPIAKEPVVEEPIVEIEPIVAAEPQPKVEPEKLEQPVVEPVVQAPKRRGRPRKNPEPVVEQPVIQEPEIEPVALTAQEEPVAPVAPPTPAVKRRGRPRKNIEPAIAETPVTPVAPKEPAALGVNLFDLDDEEEEVQEPITYNPQYYQEGIRQGYQAEEPTILPGFEDEEEEEYFDAIENTQPPMNTLQGNSYYEPAQTATLPGLDDYEEEEDDFFAPNPTTQEIEPLESYKTNDTNLEYLLAGDKKIVAFVGTSKNGTSFLVNNVAELLAEKGIKTAILDTTKNKNAYYIYTENEEELRQTAFASIQELIRGNARGIPVNKNLDVYTTIPENDEDLKECGRILETLAQNYTVVLIDCDFETDYGYFKMAQEIYLVQSMDILTIQPLTAFLTDLKAKGILQPEKLRVVINKYLRVRGVTEKVIIGGMAFYNDPTMSIMTELFNKDTVKYCVVAFDEQVYSKYLEGLVECKIATRGYTKKFLAEMVKLREMVYPLMEKSAPKYGNYKNSGFSNDMNNTLNKMKKSRY